MTHEIDADDHAENEYDEMAAVQYERFGGLTTDEIRRYWQYVSNGLADTDGYYAPLSPKAWIMSAAPAAAI